MIESFYYFYILIILLRNYKIILVEDKVLGWEFYI